MDAMLPPTPRQREFLALTAIGYGHKQIAHECNVSIWTVKATLDNARDRLCAGTLPQAVMKAIVFGYILVDAEAEMAVAN